MRPYLAILVDSFREAIYSRVLWVVLACITLVFALVFPIGLYEQATVGLHRHEVLSWPQFALRVASAGVEEKPKPSPARHIWDNLNDDARKGLADILSDDDTKGLEKEMAVGRLMKSLSGQLKDPDWYDVEAFKGVKLRKEGRELQRRIEKGESLTDHEKQRLNRLLLEAAFPETIAYSSAKSATIYYAFIGEQMLPFTQEQVEEQLPPFVVLFVDYTFGIFGILVAILITASIMPQMFEPGSLHLLLSKPVSRSMLFLTKFFGGCAFALVTVAYFALLLWLFLGTRLAIWDSRVLAAIPVYTFVFAVYYSVTALAGLLLRNTIVSVVLGIAFWAICFGLGLLHQWMNFFIVEQTRIQRIVPAEDAVLAIFPTEGFVPGMPLSLRQFKSEEGRWDVVYRSQAEGSEPFNQTYPEIGPYYDKAHDQLVSVQGSRLRGVDAAVSVGPRSPLWPRTRGAALPSTTVGVLLDRESRVIAVGVDGLHRSTKNVARAEEGTKVLGFSVPWGNGSSNFELASTGDWTFTTPPIAAAIDQSTDAIAVYSRGQAAVWRLQPDGKYALGVERALGDEKTEMMCAIAGSSALFAATDGQLYLLETMTLKTRAELRPNENNAPRQLRASPDGKQLAVLFADGTLFLHNVAEDDINYAQSPGQGTISAIAYDSSGKLLLGSGKIVTRWDPVDGTSEVVCRPKLTSTEAVFHYGVQPLYTTLPKPGELYRTLLYLLTGKKTDPSGGTDSATSGEPEFRERLRPWQPVWSGALFMLVMLAIGCIYMERMEF